MSKESESLQAIVDSRKLKVIVYPYLGNWKCAPTGEKYFTVCSRGIKSEGEYQSGFKSSKVAWKEYGRQLRLIIQRATMGFEKPIQTLYWRQKPELMSGDGQFGHEYKVFSRLLISDKPVTQSHDYNLVSTKHSGNATCHEHSHPT